MRSLSISILPLVLAAFLPACDTEAAGPPNTTPPAAPATAVVPQLASPTSAELAEAAASDNAFAADLFARARQKDGNLALSPLSIMTALTMAEAGARGETAAQMRRVLHQTGTAEHAMELSAKLVADLQRPGQRVTLRVADRLFGDQGYAFDAGFLAKLQTWFGAPLAPVDFQHATEASRGAINAWAAAETNQRIKTIIPPGGVDETTRLVLTNAVYFLGDWATQLDKGATRPEAFHASKAATHDVPTMHAGGHYAFAAKDGVRVLEMPYAGGDLAMTLVLPDAADGLGALEQRLTADVLASLTTGLTTHAVSVSLPRFEIDPAEPVALRDALTQLGMPLAFARGAADFTGIADPPRAEDRLSLGQVFHKAFVKVDEKGTEAAAVTAGTLAVAGVAPAIPSAEFRADHPFLFFLRHLRSGAVLFMGRVADPASK